MTTSIDSGSIPHAANCASSGQSSVNPCRRRSGWCRTRPRTGHPGHRFRYASSAWPHLPIAIGTNSVLTRPEQFPTPRIWKSRTSASRSARTSTLNLHPSSTLPKRLSRTRRPASDPNSVIFLPLRPALPASTSASSMLTRCRDTLQRVHWLML